MSEPESATAWAELAQGYVRAGRVAEAGPPADRAADLDPAFESLAHEWGEWRTLGRNSSRNCEMPNSLLPEPIRSLRERWRAPAGPALCPVVIAAGVAYFTEGREHLVARDLESGALRWRVPLPLEGGRPERRLLTSPSVASGLVVLSGYDWEQGAVWAHDAETGALRWSWTSEPFGWTGGANASATPVVSRQRVVSMWYGRVVALDLATGAECWVRDLGAGSEAPPVAWDGRVFVTAAERRTLLALDLTSGAELWASSTKANDLVTALRVFGEDVECIDYERSCSYSALDGALSRPPGLGEEYPQATYAGDLEVLVEGEELVLTELPSDDELYRLRLPGLPYAAPVLGPGTIAVGCSVSGEATLLVFSVS